MGHGRKRDQASHHRRHKSSSSATPGQKPSDDPFYDLQVVDEHLLWITWEELIAVLAILTLCSAAYVYVYYEDLVASFSTLERVVEYSRQSTLAKFPENNMRVTIAEQSILRSNTGDEFLQLVEDLDGDGDCVRSEDDAADDEPPTMTFDDYTDIRPHLCSDGKTYGYETYGELEEILKEINAYSHDRYVEWDNFYERTSETFDGTFDDPNLYFDEEILVTICPKSVLKRRRGNALYVNAENILIECEDCMIEIKSGSHMIFGPYAQDVMVRGIHFKGATETSVRFPHDGAEVYFEDCYFSDNGSRGKHIGTVADVNSTSSVDFLRCLMEKDVESNVLAASSLSIRTKGEES